MENKKSRGLRKAILVTKSKLKCKENNSNKIE